MAQDIAPMPQSAFQLYSTEIQEEIVVDGNLDEDVYKNKNGIYLKNSVDGHSVSDSFYTTYVQVFHNKKNLLIAFTCHDRDIHSSFSKRDEYLWKEEAVEVFIDVDDQANDYVEIEVSPKNILYDSYIVDPNNIDVEETLKFNLINIKTAVAVEGTLETRNDTDIKWTVEISIPFDELVDDFKVQQIPDFNWNINFYRINQDSSPLKLMAWSPTMGSFHQPQKFGKVFFEK